MNQQSTSALFLKFSVVFLLLLTTLLKICDHGIQRFHYVALNAQQMVYLKHIHTTFRTLSHRSAYEPNSAGSPYMRVLEVGHARRSDSLLYHQYLHCIW